MQPILAGTRHALDSRYIGPFKVVRLHDSSAEIVSLHDSEPVAAHVHLDQLKPYFPGNPVLAPDWDDALDLVLRGQRGTIEEEHPDLQDHEEETGEDHEDDQDPQQEGREEDEHQEQHHGDEEVMEFGPKREEASPRDQEAGAEISPEVQQQRQQQEEFGPQGQQSTVSPHNAPAHSAHTEVPRTHHEVIMEEPCDQIMEEEFEHLPDEDVDMAEEAAMEEGEPESLSRRPRKRSSTAREPAGKRSRSRESYLHEEEDSE